MCHFPNSVLHASRTGIELHTFHSPGGYRRLSAIRRVPILHVSPDSVLSAGRVGSIHEPMLQVRTWRLAQLGKCELVHEYYLVS